MTAQNTINATTRGLASERNWLAALLPTTEVFMGESYKGLDSGRVLENRGRVQWTGGSLDLDALAHGLTRLGVPAPRSRRLIGAALAALPPTQHTEASVLRHALASI